MNPSQAIWHLPGTGQHYTGRGALRRLAHLHGGLEGDALLGEDGADGAPAGLDVGPPQHLVAHVGEPQRLNVLGAARVVQHLRRGL